MILEQAKGVISQTAELDMATAFGMLRDYARDHNLRITELARSVVHRNVRAQEVVDHTSDVGRDSR